jgi:hypothetical protein
VSLKYITREYMKDGKRNSSTNIIRYIFIHE